MEKKHCDCDFKVNETENGYCIEISGKDVKERCKSFFENCCSVEDIKKCLEKCCN